MNHLTLFLRKKEKEIALIFFKIICVSEIISALQRRIWTVITRNSEVNLKVNQFYVEREEKFLHHDFPIIFKFGGDTVQITLVVFLTDLQHFT